MDEFLFAVWVFKWHLLLIIIITAVACLVTDHFDRCAQRRGVYPANRGTEQDQ